LAFSPTIFVVVSRRRHHHHDDDHHNHHQCKPEADDSYLISIHLGLLGKFLLENCKARFKRNDDEASHLRLPFLAFSDLLLDDMTYWKIESKN
jgi:hypothetical protein